MGNPDFESTRELLIFIAAKKFRDEITSGLHRISFFSIHQKTDPKMSGESMDTSEKTYGGCEGPDAMYVELISSDGHEFIVSRDHALTSGFDKIKVLQKVFSTFQALSRRCCLVL